MAKIKKKAKTKTISLDGMYRELAVLMALRNTDLLKQIDKLEAENADLRKALK